MRRPAKLLPLVFTLLFAISCTIVYAKSITVYVGVNIATFYAKPAASGKSAQLGYGEKLTCSEYDGTWAKVSNEKGSAWCLGDQLTTHNPNTYSVTAYATRDTFFYALPSTKSKNAKLHSGDDVTALTLTPDGQWCRVTKNGYTGYVRKSDLSKSPQVVEVSGKAYVVKSIVKLYSNATTDKPIASICCGESVQYYERYLEWVHVKYEGAIGWMKIADLSKDNPNVSPVTGYVVSASAKVYHEPSASSASLGSLDKGTAIQCIAITPDKKWLRVTANGNYAYMKKSDLSKTPPSTTVSGSLLPDGKITDVRSEIVNFAKKQLEKPYIHNTAGPDTFDCVGLTYYVIKEVTGIKLKRSSEDQGYDTRFLKISSISDLKIGDIVYFDTVPKDDDLTDHAGIYIGNGQMIHCSSVRREVMLSSITSGFYHDCFSWGRRIVQ